LLPGTLAVFTGHSGLPAIPVLVIMQLLSRATAASDATEGF
jgi:hypothetical protein